MDLVNCSREEKINQLRGETDNPITEMGVRRDGLAIGCSTRQWIQVNWHCIGSCLSRVAAREGANQIGLPGVSKVTVTSMTLNIQLCHHYSGFFSR